jgi:RNA polymerase sigma-70 factor (ECF subfamily)
LQLKTILYWSQAYRKPNKIKPKLVILVERTIECLSRTERNSKVINTQTDTTQAEQDLVTSAQAGDRGAFGELVQLHLRGVVNLVYRLSGELAFSEDIAQEAFIRAWEKLPGYLPNSPFRNWLYRIATNAAIDALRRRKEEVNIDGVVVSAPGSSLEQKLEHKQRDETIRQAVLSLPLASRSVLILREYQQLSYAEIAATLEIPLGTVMSRLNYARTTLRINLAQLLEAQ